MTLPLFDTYLNIVGNGCAVLTAGVAVWFFCWTRAKRKSHVQDVEGFLKNDRRQRSVMAIMKGLKLSEDEVWEACRGSDSIKLVATTDNDGFVKQILFQFVDA